jgi:hypothetical protein
MCSGLSDVQMYGIARGMFYAVRFCKRMSAHLCDIDIPDRLGGVVHGQGLIEIDLPDCLTKRQ